MTAKWIIVGSMGLVLVVLGVTFYVLRSKINSVRALRRKPPQ